MQRVTRGRKAQAGLTIVELLVSMALVGLMIAMVFSLFIQSSMAYRTTAQVAELQQVLVAANNVVLRDLRNAGNRVAAGFRVAGGQTHWPIEIDNRSTGPDELRMYFASSEGFAVTSWASGTSPIGVTIPAGTSFEFKVGDLILLADPQEVPPNVDPAPPVVYDACVGEVAAFTGGMVTLSTVAPWGATGNPHCDFVRAQFNTGGVPETLAFKFAARGYRIDPTRLDLGVLQLSESAGFENDWQDMGIGFTDMQVASRWFEDGDLNDEDGDGDDELDWYSGDDQTTMTAPGAVAGVPTELTVSFVLRSSKKVSGVVTAATPNLTETGNVDNNPVGDRAAVQLEGVPDSSRPEELRGNHVFRYSTSRVDLRNMEIR